MILEFLPHTQAWDLQATNFSACCGVHGWWTGDEPGQVVRGGAGHLFEPSRAARCSCVAVQQQCGGTRNAVTATAPGPAVQPSCLQNRRYLKSG